MRRVLAVAAMAVLLLGGCARAGTGTGGGGGAGVASDGPGIVHVGSGIAEDYPPIEPTALDRWRDFPANAHPRPIVLIYGPVNDPGYETGEAKERALTAGYTLPALPLPQPAPTVTVALPDGPADLPTVSAATAFQTLQSQVDTAGATLTPLPIVAVSLASATFHTDRGDLALPAWQFTAQDGLGPIVVPALASSVFWHFTEFHAGTPGRPATVSTDGRTLHVTVFTWLGCDGKPPTITATSTETPEAVAVGTRAVFPPQPSDCVVPDIARMTDVSITLKAPLGARVLVTGSGAPVTVATR